MSEEFTPITSQDQLNDILKSRLARAEESVRKQFADYEDVKAKATAFETELNALKNSHKEYVDNSQKEINDLNSKIRAYENSSVKMSIALESGLPLELANRLTGETPEEIRKDADIIMKAMHISKRQPLGSTETSGDLKDQALRSMLGDLMK